jgi:hypothetical protein
MSYTVVWVPSALRELADLWNEAPQRQEVTDVANLLDEWLRAHPYADSESREGNLRILFFPPLAVLFEVSDPDCLVTVRAVWSPG